MGSPEASAWQSSSPDSKKGFRVLGETQVYRGKKTFHQTGRPNVNPSTI